MPLEIKENAVINRVKQFSVDGTDVACVSADINLDAPCSVSGLSPCIQDYELYEQYQDEIAAELIEFNKVVFADKNRLKGEQK